MFELQYTFENHCKVVEKSICRKGNDSVVKAKLMRNIR